MTGADHIAGHTWHGRRGAVSNSFRYGVDYVLIDPNAKPPPTRLFSRNRFNLAALHDRDHGGPPGKGRGVAWARDVLGAHGFDEAAARILLLTQPRILGYVFNPVSFWLCHDAEGRLRAVIAEVTNTFGDRHSYLCHREDREPIGPQDTLEARKLLHVSPYQPVDGGYGFTFDIRPDRIGIRIDYRRPDGGLMATLTGPRQPLTDRGILASCVRRPFGSVRVMALIYWQAMRLKLKGATYRVRPEPPTQEVSR
ncbi:DUF1365 domain-containing protein [Tropicimonas isoalkanivorans]|uniref:Cyclopropane-fatty-acyl-phospholipid synthase n=1 Tax=Tropicimonas isoalkanivorans TaxID=441112 RepID=A0A1I1P0J6_9RHOB|nr:DUF1365 domain-containing protein [Tropicimonas isoalkanivorans]SFD01248.1 hypothetical protein SAMN04488094_11321 [Tropicimonas isoalkanivorans]